MIEDLETEEEVINCLYHWGRNLLIGSHIVLLVPDMQGGRYPKVEEGGNPSHRINVGKEFFTRISKNLLFIKLVQIDTIPHDKSCSMDVVFRRVWYEGEDRPK